VLLDEAYREATAPGSTVRGGGYLVAVLIHKTPGRASPRLVPSPSASRSNFHANVSHRRGRTDAFEAGKQERRDYGHHGNLNIINGQLNQHITGNTNMNIIGGWRSVTNDGTGTVAMAGTVKTIALRLRSLGASMLATFTLRGGLKLRAHVVNTKANGASVAVLKTARVIGFISSASSTSAALLMLATMTPSTGITLREAFSSAQQSPGHSGLQAPVRPRRSRLLPPAFRIIPRTRNSITAG
jgi:hypothetical protein